MNASDESNREGLGLGLGLGLGGRVAIVTGGSRGIGRGIALHLASLGARLVVNYSSSSAQADLVVAQINQLHSNNSDGPPRAVAVGVRADVSDPEQVKFLFDKAEEFFGGPPHILVNSAGVLDPKYPSIANTLLDDFDRIFRFTPYNNKLLNKFSSR